MEPETRDFFLSLGKFLVIISSNIAFPPIIFCFPFCDSNMLYLKLCSLYYLSNNFSFFFSYPSFNLGIFYQLVFLLTNPAFCYIQYARTILFFITLVLWWNSPSYYIFSWMYYSVILKSVSDNLIWISGSSIDLFVNLLPLVFYFSMPGHFS